MARSRKKGWLRPLMLLIVGAIAAPAIMPHLKKVPVVGALAAKGEAAAAGAPSTNSTDTTV